MGSLAPPPPEPPRCLPRPLRADEDREKLSVLDTLTGLPRPDDVLLFAVPVCAPYSTLQSYKLKVKLIPGRWAWGWPGAGLGVRAAAQHVEPPINPPSAQTCELNCRCSSGL